MENKDLIIENKDLMIENLNLKIVNLEREILLLKPKKLMSKNKPHVKNVKNIKGYEEYKERIVELVTFKTEEALLDGRKLKLTAKDITEELKDVLGVEIKPHTCGKILSYLYKDLKSNMNGTNYYNFVK